MAVLPGKQQYGTNTDMCVKQPKDAVEYRLQWVLPIANKEVRLTDAAAVFPRGRRTLERWVSDFKKSGAKGLEPRSTRPKNCPGETPEEVRRAIVRLRKENNKCALKLESDLKGGGIRVGARAIGKILKKEGLTRRYRTKKLKIKYLKVPLLPGELVEIDVKYVPKTLGNRQYYQYTAIDCASRWRYLKIYGNMGNSEAVDFLEELKKAAPFRIRAVKTDNGSCFTNRYTGYRKSADPYNPKIHAFDLRCQRGNVIHYLIDPGKPAQNGRVERSHRSDQEAF